MKDYISENRVFLGKGGYNNLVLAVNQNTRNIKTLQETMLTKADLPVFIELFDQQASGEEALILDGQPLKADVAYQRIYRKAKDSLVVVDDYIGVKTLQHIAHAKRTVSLTVVSDNRGRHPLRKNEYDDFRLEYKNRNIDFVQSKNKVHDRYILIDNSVVYHCGTSSKDAGNKVTTITRLQDGGSTISMIRQMLKHPKLTLR